MLRSTDVLPAFPDLSYLLFWRQARVRAVVCWKATRDALAFWKSQVITAVGRCPCSFLKKTFGVLRSTFSPPLFFLESHARPALPLFGAASFEKTKCALRSTCCAPSAVVFFETFVRPALPLFGAASFEKAKCGDSNKASRTRRRLEQGASNKVPPTRRLASNEATPRRRRLEQGASNTASRTRRLVLARGAQFEALFEASPC